MVSELKGLMFVDQNPDCRFLLNFILCVPITSLTVTGIAPSGWMRRDSFLQPSRTSLHFRFIETEILTSRGPLSVLSFPGGE